MFDRPHLLWLLLLVPLAATPGILAMRSGLRLAGAAAATLRALCVVRARCDARRLAHSGAHRCEERRSGRGHGRVAFGVARSAGVDAAPNRTVKIRDGADRSAWDCRLRARRPIARAFDRSAAAGALRRWHRWRRDRYRRCADRRAKSVRTRSRQENRSPERRQRNRRLCDERGSHDARGRRADFCRCAAAVGYRASCCQQFLCAGRGARRSALRIQNRR